MTLPDQAILNDWSPPIVVDVTIILSAALYLRGWLILRRSSPGLLGTSKLVFYFAGLSCFWIAIGSPLSAFDEGSLTVHMVQHILLMFVVPPLILLGAPSLPMLHGLPQAVVRGPLGSLMRLRALQAGWTFLTHPAVCWLLAAVAMIAWHVPVAFNLALRSETWHDIEHLCFLSTSLLFWWPVIQPFPSVPRWPRWSVPVYLFVGMFPSAALGAFLAFCDRVLYAYPPDTTPLFGLTPLEDQIFAGALMWVMGFLVCVLPAVKITLQLLSPATSSSTPDAARAAWVQK